jgi:parallel beta-helix repeat protein
MLVMASREPGYADGGARIRACIAALPATGGVCDFRNQGAMSAARTIVVSKPTTLLLDQTQLTLSGTPGMLIAADGVRIDGSVGQTELVQGGTLGSTGSNHNVIYGNTLSDLKIEGVRFVGIPCSSPEDNNSGVKLQNNVPGNIDRVRIVGNAFTGFCQHAVLIQNATDVTVEDNLVQGVADGIRFSGVTSGKIVNNVIRDTELPSSGAFAVAIGLDTTAQQDDGIHYPVSTDIHVSRNTVSGYPNGEGVMVHAGANVLISENVFDDVLMGIGINPFVSTDLLYRVTITGNSYVGTTRQGALHSTGNTGIYVGGSEQTLSPSYVVVTHNIISQANEIARSPAQGGIGVGYADHVLVEGNVVRDSMNHGIYLRSGNREVVVRDNEVSGITRAN